MRSAVTILHSRSSQIFNCTLLTLTLAITVPCAQPQSIVHADTATLTGTVVDATGAVIPKAILNLEKADSSRLQTTTDSNGHFAIEAPPGEYMLSVSARGFQISKQLVHLTSGTPDVGKILLSLSSMETGGCTCCVVTGETIQLEVPDKPLDLLLSLNPLPPYKFTTRNVKHLRS